MHTLLYYGPAVWQGVRRIPIEKDDIHAKLMRAYPEVPDWWYAAVFVIFFSLAIVASEVSRSHSTFPFFLAWVSGRADWIVWDV